MNLNMFVLTININSNAIYSTYLRWILLHAQHHKMIDRIETAISAVSINKIARMSDRLGMSNAHWHYSHIFLLEANASMRMPIICDWLKVKHSFTSHFTNIEQINRAKVWQTHAWTEIQMENCESSLQIILVNTCKTYEQYSRQKGINKTFRAKILHCGMNRKRKKKKKRFRQKTLHLRCAKYLNCSQKATKNVLLRPRSADYDNISSRMYAVGRRGVDDDCSYLFLSYHQHHIQEHSI